MPTETATYRRCAELAAHALAGAPGRRADDAALYLAHVEAATPLRRLALAAGRPVSTVHRAIRRVEALRDDMLMDAAFDAMARRLRAASASDGALPRERASGEDREALALRALDRLSETGAFLMVARGAERAGVFSRRNGFRRPLVLLPLGLAAEMAARDWVRCDARTAASARYVATTAGRRAARARRAAEAAPASERGERTLRRADGSVETIRLANPESPLAWLASRKGADGSPFLAAEEVEAGERLRVSYETDAAGADFTAAEAALGPGLADVAVGACCRLEGLESIERRMGWSARSGKVVLKLALQRLAAHYAGRL